MGLPNSDSVECQQLLQKHRRNPGTCFSVPFPINPSAHQRHHPTGCGSGSKEGLGTSSVFWLRKKLPVFIPKTVNELLDCGLPLVCMLIRSVRSGARREKDDDSLWEAV